jgi:hypothetical protein
LILACAWKGKKLQLLPTASLSSTHLFDVLIEFAFELIALPARGIEANVRVDAKMPLQMRFQIVFVDEFGVADIAEILSRAIANARTGQCNELVIWIAGFGGFINGTIETSLHWWWLSIKLVVRHLLILVAQRLDFDLVA